MTIPANETGAISRSLDATKPPSEVRTGSPQTVDTEECYDTVAGDREDHEEDVQHAQHVMQERVGRLEGPPVRMHVLHVISRNVPADHVELLTATQNSF